MADRGLYGAPFLFDLAVWFHRLVTVVWLKKYMHRAYVFSMSMENLTNQLGALTLALADEQNLIVTAIAGANVSASALVVVLGLYPGETIRDAAQVLSLSHSATVRLVEQLVEKGLVERMTGQDRREVQLRLTRRGKLVRQQLLKARADLFARALSRLTAAELRVAETLVGTMLATITEDEVHADRICRFCDEEACGDCPVEHALDDPSGLPTGAR